MRFVIIFANDGRRLSPCFKKHLQNSTNVSDASGIFQTVVLRTIGRTLRNELDLGAGPPVLVVDRVGTIFLQIGPVDDDPFTVGLLAGNKSRVEAGLLQDRNITIGNDVHRGLSEDGACSDRLGADEIVSLANVETKRRHLALVVGRIGADVTRAVDGLSVEDVAAAARAEGFVVEHAPHVVWRDARRNSEATDLNGPAVNVGSGVGLGAGDFSPQSVIWRGVGSEGGWERGQKTQAQSNESGKAHVD